MIGLIETLKQDHINFLRLLKAFEFQAHAAARGERPSFQILHGVVLYFSDYPVKIHHPREELLLDVLKHRVPDINAKIAAILEFHKHIGVRIQDVSTALHEFEEDQIGERIAFWHTAERFVIAERDHIHQEDTRLFPLAEQHLKKEDWVWLDSAIGNAKDPLFGKNVAQPLANLRDIILNADAHRSPER